MNGNNSTSVRNKAQEIAAQKKRADARHRAVRFIAPAIPLAIALMHGIATHKPTPPAKPPQTPTSISTTTVVPTACAGDYCTVPEPMLAKGHPVKWWFVFKLNASKFPGCGGGDARLCPFGGEVQTSYTGFGQQYVYASNELGTLKAGGKECVGDTTGDPVGATFDEIYNGTFHYVVWNDQPYNDPTGECSGDSCGAPWAHSKGMLAWDDAGDGMVMQVSTPSWPLAASAKNPRKTDGNTLGCVKDNNVKVSQHFFALKLSKSDLLLMLEAVRNASVVTDPKNIQVVNNGGPTDVQQIVNDLGNISQSRTVTTGMLSNGVEVISKPSKLAVPPWQMVSAELGGAPLRVASWWIEPDAIPSTTADTPMGCWDPELNKPGPVEIATSGTWSGMTFGLKGGSNPDGNHAKFAVSTSGTKNYVIFGDMNQEGSIGGDIKCTASQNGRGGLFFVLKNATLNRSISALIAGDSAPLSTADN